MSFIVTVPNPKTSFLTLAQLRLATGASSASISDQALWDLGEAVTSMMVASCGVKADNTHDPKFFPETIVETFRNTMRHRLKLPLSRRFVTSVTSVVERSLTLTPEEYVCYGTSGYLERLRNDYPSYWLLGTTTITYVAGFDPPPAEFTRLAMVASKQLWAIMQTNQSPFLKSEWVNEVGRREYFQNVAASAGILDQSVAAELTDYATISF